MRVLRCDCGFETTEAEEAALVHQAQAHAHEVHGMDLPAELVLVLVDGEARRQPHQPELPAVGRYFQART